MKLFDISGNDLAIEAWRAWGVNGMIILFAFALVAVGGRATGFLPIVGYQSGSQMGYSLAKAEVEPLSITGPAFLSKGEKLIAHYDATVEAGRIKLYVREGSAPISMAQDTKERFSIEQTGSGTYEFVAPEDGVYWPKSRIMSGQATEACKESRSKKNSAAAKALDPSIACKGRSASFSVWWVVGE